MSGLARTPEHRMSVGDVVAGVSVALVAIPQSLAYAEIAGLPGQHGLYAASLPLIAAAWFASSPYLQTGPVATTALLTFGALVPLAPVGTAEYVGLAALLALVVGVARILIGTFRVGWLSYLMSRPMLEGFMSGAALLIIASQVPGIFGVSPPEGGVVGRALWTLMRPGEWEATATLLTVLTVVLILGGRRLDPRLPGVLIAVGAGVLFSLTMGYEGPRVGSVPTAFPPLTLDLPWSRIPGLVLPGTVIAMVGFAEAASISRAFASEDRMRWDANREFVSQGFANVVSGFTGGFPVGGSLSRSSLNRIAGARSRWSAAITGVCVLAFLPLANLLAPLPRAVLAGIVIAAVWKLVRPGSLLRLWKVSRAQAIVGWTTFGLTLTLAPHVEHAVLIGILSAGAVHLWRELRIDVRSRREGDTLHIEPFGVLWFGSAPALDDEILIHLSREEGIARVEIHCRGLGRIDLTGAHSLAEMLDLLRATGLEVDIVEVPQHAERVLRASGLYGAPAAGRASATSRTGETK